jgi:hypothetical protein
MGIETEQERKRRWNNTYKEKHPERVKEANRKYYQSPEGKAKREEWLIKNPGQAKLSKYKHYLKNKEKYDAAAREYAALHPEWKAAHCAKRRATRLNATPSWVDNEELFLIEEAYKLAALRMEITGGSWDVDHIIPLTSKYVCGLHTIHNLQVVPSSYNYRKHNKLLNEDYFSRAI